MLTYNTNQDNTFYPGLLFMMKRGTRKPILREVHLNTEHLQTTINGISFIDARWNTAYVW